MAPAEISLRFPVRGELVMTETTLCGYCVDLPECGPAAAAQVSRCPLCKTALGVTAAGRRFRIGAAPARRSRRWRIVLVATAALGCAIVLAATWLYPHPAGEAVSLPSAPTPVVPVFVPPGSSALEGPAASPPQIAAVVKTYVEGVLSPAARLKSHSGHG